MNNKTINAGAPDMRYKGGYKAVMLQQQHT
jgi:hypothetical protein